MTDVFVIICPKCVKENEDGKFCRFIVNNQEAINTKGCVAYQCMKSIENGGTGSYVSSTFEVLVDFDVLRVVREADGHVWTSVPKHELSAGD